MLALNKELVARIFVQGRSLKIGNTWFRREFVETHVDGETYEMISVQNPGRDSEAFDIMAFEDLVTQTRALAWGLDQTA